MNDDDSLNVKWTTVEPIQLTRRIEFLAIHKTELINISYFNSIFTMFCSLGSFFISTTLSIFLSCFIGGTEKLDVKGNVILYFVAPLTLILAISFFVAAFFNRRGKNSIMQIIEEESKSKQ